MYSLDMPVSKIRTKTRAEFEKHRYAGQLKTVDRLIQNSHAEYQVGCTTPSFQRGRVLL